MTPDKRALRAVNRRLQRRSEAGDQLMLWAAVVAVLLIFGAAALAQLLSLGW